MDNGILNENNQVTQTKMPEIFQTNVIFQYKQFKIISDMSRRKL